MSIIENEMDIHPNSLHNRNCSSCGESREFERSVSVGYTVSEKCRFAAQDVRLLGCEILGWMSI